MLFPDSVRPIIPYEWHFAFATISSRNAESGRLQTRAARAFDLMSASLTFPIRPIADYNALRSFCRAVRGVSTRFTFLDFNGTAATYNADPLAPWPVDATWGAAGSGSVLCTMPSSASVPGAAAITDGSTTIFDLPFRSSSGAVVYLDLASTSSYSILTGGGIDGRDRVQFSSAPAANKVVTASCTLGRLAIFARLASDSFDGKTFVGSGGPIQPTLTIVQDVI